MRRVGSVVVAAGLVLGLVGPVEAATGGAVRVNQLGYGAFDGKAAYVLSPGAVTGRAFRVVDGRGRQVLTGRVGAELGEWNAKYQHVSQLDLTRLWVPGTYRVEVPGVAASPP